MSDSLTHTECVIALHDLLVGHGVIVIVPDDIVPGVYWDHGSRDFIFLPSGSKVIFFKTTQPKTNINLILILARSVGPRQTNAVV